MKLKNNKKELLGIKITIVCAIVLLLIIVGACIALILGRPANLDDKTLYTTSGYTDTEPVSTIYKEETAEESSSGPVIVYPGGTTEDTSSDTSSDISTEIQESETDDTDSTSEVASEIATTPVETTAPYILSIEAIYHGFSKMAGESVPATDLVVIATYSDGNVTAINGWRCDMIDKPLSAGMNRFDIYYENLHSGFELEGHVQETLPPETIPVTIPVTTTAETTTEEPTSEDKAAETETTAVAEGSTDADASSDPSSELSTEVSSATVTTAETTPPQTTRPPVQIGHVVWVGDSRYVGMSNYKTGGDVFIAKVGCGWQYVSETYNQIIQNAPGNALVFGIGVNDCYHPDAAYQYVNLVNQIASQVSCPVFVQLVIHVNEAQETKYNYHLTNANIDRYNQILLSNLASGIQIINGNDYIAMATDPSVTNDGLHLKPEYNNRVYNAMRARVYELL